jgi:TorA maturation chaperone TorD
MKEAQKEAEERSKSLYLLSYFFLERPKNFIDKIKDNDFVKFLKKFEYFDEFYKEIEKMREDELLDILTVDFTKLMRGIKEGYSPLPPYESLWRGENLMDCEEILEFYRKANVGMDLKNELPDHIGIELKFLSILAYKEKEYLEKRDYKGAEKFLNYQKKFLEEHILRWVPDFLKIMEEKAITKFYKGLSTLTRKVIFEIKERIEEIEEIYKNNKKEV